MTMKLIDGRRKLVIRVGLLDILEKLPSDPSYMVTRLPHTPFNKKVNKIIIK